MLVAQVRYTEMTDEGRLRHPAYLGLRDDKAQARASEGAAHGEPARTATALRRARDQAARRVGRRQPARRSRPAGRLDPRRRRRRRAARTTSQTAAQERQARAARTASTLEVTNLTRCSGPRASAPRATCCATTRASRRYILPVVDDRPLVMKRCPTASTARRSTSTARPSRCRRACASRRCPTTTCRAG